MNHNFGVVNYTDSCLFGKVLYWVLFFFFLFKGGVGGFAFSIIFGTFLVSCQVCKTI